MKRALLAVLVLSCAAFAVTSGPGLPWDSDKLLRAWILGIGTDEGWGTGGSGDSSWISFSADTGNVTGGLTAARFRGALIGDVTGNATTADSSKGGATRATTAQSLQGQDTTALWNAKTLQGRDTTTFARPNDSATVSGAAYRKISRVADSTTKFTPTPNCDLIDQYNLTALDTSPTFAAPAGTPASGQKLLIRVVDNGTAHTLGWNAIYRGAPTATPPDSTFYIGFIYNAQVTRWDCVGTSKLAPLPE